MGLIALAFGGILIVMFVGILNSRRSSRPARRAPDGGDGSYYGGDVIWMDSDGGGDGGGSDCGSSDGGGGGDGVGGDGGCAGGD
jgi:hypothetical protein